MFFTQVVFYTILNNPVIYMVLLPQYYFKYMFILNILVFKISSKWMEPLTQMKVARVIVLNAHSV